MNNYTLIDEATWNRALHCKIFRNSIEPAFCVTFELDVTRFLERIRAQKLSFTLSMVYAACACARKIENFRYRFLDGKAVLFAGIDTAFTYLNRESELFKVVYAPMQDTLAAFVANAACIAQAQQEYFTGPLPPDVFICSPLPFVSYTHISHTNGGKKDNATPLFDWGKYFLREGRMIMPFSVQAHHSFVDGLHIGRLAESLQTFLNEDDM